MRDSFNLRFSTASRKSVESCTRHHDGLEDGRVLLTEAASRGTLHHDVKRADPELARTNEVNPKHNPGTVRRMIEVGRTHAGFDRFNFESEKLVSKCDPVHARFVRRHFVNDRDNLAPDRNAFATDTLRSEFDSFSAGIGRFAPVAVPRDLVNRGDNVGSGSVDLELRCFTFPSGRLHS
jgi:hypothetical protein